MCVSDGILTLYLGQKCVSEFPHISHILAPWKSGVVAKSRCKKIHLSHAMHALNGITINQRMSVSLSGFPFGRAFYL